MNSYRAFLLTVRDNPAIASPAALLTPTRAQVLAEHKAWQTIQALLDHISKVPRADRYKLNPKRKTFIYEWQNANEASRAHLVDVFLRTDADWSFVTREPEWDNRFGSIVDVFLFSRKAIDGRDATFAAQELIPVYKQHLDAAVAKAATSFVLTLGVPASGYDFESKSIKFLPTGTNAQQGLPYQNGTELLESTDHPKFEGLVLPASAASTATYHLFGAVRSMHAADPPLTKLGSDVGHTSPTQSWRSAFSIGSSGAGEGENIPYVEVLALDRQLRLTSIPLDPVRAEKIAKAANYATMGTISGLTVKAYFDADRVELSHRTVDGRKARYGVLFARLRRLDIHGPDGELLTSFKPESLPAPAPRTTTPEPAPATLPPEQTETLAERQSTINQDVTTKTNAIVADLKKKSDAQLAQAAAASQAASATAAQPPSAQGQSSGASAPSAAPAASPSAVPSQPPTPPVPQSTALPAPSSPSAPGTVCPPAPPVTSPSPRVTSSAPAVTSPAPATASGTAPAGPAQVPGTPLAGVQPSNPIVQCWLWSNGVQVAFNGDGTMTYGPTPYGQITGRWRAADPARRTYIFNWPGPIDTAVVSADGTTLAESSPWFVVTSTRASQGTGIVGWWRWPNGVVVMIEPDGTFRAGPIAGTWQAANSAERTYTLRWPELTNTVTMSDDRRRLDGADQYGNRFAAVKSDACTGQ